ncbi:MAG: hypothetical protein RL299_45, partial [Pseudomonadota bacterium]
SPQYDSHAAYMIRGTEQKNPDGGLLASLAAQGTGGPAQGESLAVRDFMRSADAIAALKKQGIDVSAHYADSQADWFSRLTPAQPRAEDLLEYYRSQVQVDFDEQSGMTKIRVRAFAPQEARRIALALIALGEERVNTFNQRAVAAAQQDAQANLASAEEEIATIQGKLTAFRDLTRDIDPARQGEGTQARLEKVEAELIEERANLAGMRASLSAGSPLVVSATARVRTLERTAAELRGKLTGGAGAVNNRLAAYEELKLKQELAVKRYDDARARLSRANDQAARERLFLVQVVSANLPDKPARPRPLSTTLMVLLGLATAFAIGWLLLAGVREHMAD